MQIVLPFLKCNVFDNAIKNVSCYGQMLVIEIFISFYPTIPKFLDRQIWAKCRPISDRVLENLGKSMYLSSLETDSFKGSS